jgi:peptide deformylase
MAILKIARMGHPVLARPAKPVADATAPKIRRLVADMVETMEDAHGTGLAAPQVHVPLRVVVFFVDGERSRREDGEAELEGGHSGVPLTVMINPVIEPLGPEKELGWEACLSVPELMGQVPRWRRVRYRFQDLDGRQHERTAEGFHARVVQHECDHLDGVLYPQRLADAKTLIFASEAHHIAAAQEAQVA